MTTQSILLCYLDLILILQNVWMLIYVYVYVECTWSNKFTVQYKKRFVHGI
jgi:hypothetical protein